MLSNRKFKIINLERTILLINRLLFGNISCMLKLNKFNNFDEYLKSLKSKKRRELNKIINREYNEINIKEGKFNKEYLHLLYNFLKNKYNSKILLYFYMFLSINLFIIFELNFWEYYKDGEFLGWSSYFIYKDTYYDFISSPNKFNLSIIGINSIKYCIKNKIKNINMGSTNIKLKMQKFDAEIYEY